MTKHVRVFIAFTEDQMGLSEKDIQVTIFKPLGPVKLTKSVVRTILLRSVKAFMNSWDQEKVDRMYNLPLPKAKTYRGR